MTEARVFKTKDKEGKEVILKFVKPTQAVLSKGDFVYRENFSKAIRAGFMTNAEASKVLEDRGIWTTRHEEDSLALRNEISELEEKISTMDRVGGLELFKKIKDLRDKLDGLTSIRSSVMNNTAESAASEMRTQFYASECVLFNDGGKRVFKDFNDFLGRLDESLALDSYRQALIANYEQIFGIKLSQDLESTLPEDVWLKTLKEEKTPEPQAANATQELQDGAEQVKKGRKKKDLQAS